MKHLLAGVMVSASMLVAAQDPQFEAAALKRNTGVESGQMVDQQGNQYRAVNVTLRTLILNAYRPRSTELVGAPGWIGSDRYDLVAIMPPGATTEDRAAMLRSLLKERAALAAHYEDREGAVYFLTPARGDARLGSQIRISPRDCAAAAAASRDGRPAPPMPPAENGAPPCGIRTTPGEFLAGGITMDGFARNLANRAGRIVIDRTGLTGYYELTLRFDPGTDPAAASNTPSFFTALSEQLGLKLEPGRTPLQTLVIDHIERPAVE